MENRLRLREVQRIRIRIERDGFPRLQMLFLVTLTGVAGFIASFILLVMGMEVMWERYLAAVGIAYIVFLGLLWLWMHTKTEDYLNLVDIPGSLPSRTDSTPMPVFRGGGGTADGGGASGNFETLAGDLSIAEAASSSATGQIGDAVSDAAGDVVGDAFGAVSDADEVAIPLIVIVLVIGAVLSSLYVVYTAPLLFAELMVDGMLTATLYRRLRRMERRNWLQTALRRTAIPFLLTAVFIAAAGWGMGQYAPEAHSIGGVLAHRANGG